MNGKWSTVRLSEIVTPVEREEIPVVGTSYRQIGVKLWGEGAYEREQIDGGATKYAQLFRAEAGDIIVNKIWARNGSVAVVQASLAGCYGSGEFPMFAPNRERLDPGWMHWLMKTRGFWAQCNEKSRGTSGKNRIRPERFLEIAIPLPPIAEQQRIVARIEELFAQIQEARALRQKAVQDLEKLYEVTIANWCYSNHNIRKFGELLEDAKNGIYKPPMFWGTGVPCIRMYNIEGPNLNQVNLQLLEVSEEELNAYGCKPGDLIFNRVNSAELVGKTGLITSSFPRCVYESKNMRLRLKRSLVLPEFAALVLNSTPIRKHYKQVLKQQCGMATLNQSHVRDIPFPDIEISEQLRIMAYLNHLTAKVGEIKRLQAETAIELDVLLPSILDRAFKDEL